MDVDVKGIAQTAENLFEGFMKVEPFIMMASSFIPGAKPVMAVLHPAVVAAAPFIEKALDQLAAGNNGDALTAFIQLIQHITANQPNAQALSGTVAEQEQSSQAG